MVHTLQVSSIVLVGLLIGLVGSLFDPRALAFRDVSFAAIRDFPYASFLPGLMVGLVLGAAYTLDWSAIRKRVWLWVTHFGRMTDLAVIALIAVAVLFYV